MNQIRPYKICSFFAGVGGIDLGFELTNNFKVIWANEIDASASLTYRMNFENELLTADIKNIESNMVPSSDVIIAGFPCQAFSVAGYKKGFEDDRGILFFDLLRIIKDKLPRVVFLENVKNLVGHDKGNTFKVIKEALEFHGYKIKSKVLNAKDYGNVPQNRERIYIVAFQNKMDYANFDFPEPIPMTRNIEDVVDYSIDEKRFYYDSGKYKISSEIQSSVVSKDSVYQWRRKYVRENKSKVFPTLTANMGTGGHNVPIILTDFGIRKITPRECFNIQGYPNSFILPNIALSQLYKQAGNSVVVPVITRIAERISISLRTTDENCD